METFKIEVMEILSRIVEVKAESLEEALSLIWQEYYKEIIVLDYSDHVTTEIKSFID